MFFNGSDTLFGTVSICKTNSEKTMLFYFRHTFCITIKSDNQVVSQKVCNFYP